MYHLRLPASPLRPFIESYWKVQTRPGESGVLHEQIYVDGQPDILFNFGCAYDRCGIPIPHGNVDGQRDYPVVIAQQGEINLIGVRFRPGGLAAFTRLPMHELANQVLDLRNGLEAGAAALEYHLYDAADFDQQASLLDRFFLSRLHSTESHQLTLHLARQIASGEANIQQVSAEAGYSIRTVDRLFRQHLGLTPRLYARIQRFQAALRLLSGAGERSFLQIALATGYYDQAHFTHDFSAFAGMTPTAFRQRFNMQQANPQSVQFIQD
ncbi:MAG: AraC family transcriptional regulator [Anaerolineae bacterium]|nr:AraC family transcriptional regulator [Anaerolineae bacterium]